MALCDTNLKVACYNSNGFCSTKPYVDHLLKSHHVVGICEHWLSGPELYKLNAISQSHSVVGKCHRNLQNAPPLRGRGYGGVALYWDKNIIGTPVLGIECDRIIGLCIKNGMRSTFIFNVYYPTSECDEFYKVTDELTILINKYGESQGHEIIVMGDFNVSFGKEAGPRGNGPSSPRGALVLMLSVTG